MRENLKTTKYNNGEPLIKINDSTRWINTKEGAYCDAIGVIHYYDGDIKDSLNEYFYNQYVVLDTRNVCPIGWRVPDTSDYCKLEKMIRIIEKKYCNADSTHIMGKWVEGYTKNDLGFSEFPLGLRRGKTAEYDYYMDFGYWWTINKNYAANAWARCMGYDGIFLDKKEQYNINDGMSIKCIKNNNR
jgi:uncharacterized protein (TIGR02145 family)